MGWTMMDDGEWSEMAQREMAQREMLARREMQAPRTCPACGGTYTRADGGHRHRATVSVPVKPWGEGRDIRWVDVGVLVDVAARDGEADAVSRAVRQVHGARAVWRPDAGVRGYGQVFRGQMGGGGMSAVTDRVGEPVVTYVRR